MPRVEAVRCLPTQHRRGNGTAGGSARCMGHWDSGSRCRERRASQYTRCIPGQWKVFFSSQHKLTNLTVILHRKIIINQMKEGKEIRKDLRLRNRHEAVRIVLLLDSVVPVAVASKLSFTFRSWSNAPLPIGP